MFKMNTILCLSFSELGAEANFMLKIHPLKKYPVDLYYLVDVSASMHNNIEKLNSVGNDLSRKMAFFSHDFRLGFGSYVDKTVSPYISIHPERIHNQCRYLIFDVDFLMLNKFKIL